MWFGCLPQPNESFLEAKPEKDAPRANARAAQTNPPMPVAPAQHSHVLEKAGCRNFPLTCWGSREVLYNSLEKKQFAQG